ncbi:nuclear transport factor 2 family protein [Acidocella sp.]|uniref:nuclear transport factor 2 family protein n=1 Tax=Acidocella sp. TaxID=50710 RepID=UPI002618FF0B|nr:nuclear transport factor 2 family protein [Acidocella sp.]
MRPSTMSEQCIERVRHYFQKGDAGDSTIIEMFTDDIELYFPKFGTRRGKAAVAAFLQGLLSQLQSLQHFPDRYTYIASENFVVVEGWETGISKDGTTWPVPGRSDGRFCNVFRFREDLISHLHIYVDPDFLGQDLDRFFWGALPAAPEEKR